MSIVSGLAWLGIFLTEDSILLQLYEKPGAGGGAVIFFCELGQIYNGQILKGLILLVAYFISWMMMWIVWIWGIVDAYRVAQKFNAQLGGVPPF